MVIPGVDDEEGVGEAVVLRVAALVEHLPGDQHGHHDRLAAAGRHLARHAEQVGPAPSAAVARCFSIQVSPYFVCLATSVMKISVSRASIWQKNSRRKAVRGVPVFKQRAGHGRHVRPAAVSPQLDACRMRLTWSLSVFFSSASRSSNSPLHLLLRRGDREEVAALAPALVDLVRDRVRVVEPEVPRRLVERRVQNRVLDDDRGHGWAFGRDAVGEQQASRCCKCQATPGRGAVRSMGSGDFPVDPGLSFRGGDSSFNFTKPIHRVHCPGNETPRLHRVLDRIMSIGKWTCVTLAGIIGAILKAKPENFPQDIGELLTWIQNNAWWMLVSTAVFTAVPRVIQHFLGPPWVWESIQKVLNLLCRRALKKKHEKDDVHDHRVTLFKHCRVWSTLCWVRRDRTGRRRWPTSGWLVPVSRSGHTTQKTGHYVSGTG